MARKKIPLTWVCAAAAILVVGAGAMVHWHLLSSRRAALAAAEAQVQAAADANAQAEQGLRELPTLRQSVREFARCVPPDPDISALLGSVGGDVASSAGPQREIVSKPTVPGQPLARVPFSLTYRGSFDGTVSLLQRLHNGELFARIERIVIDNDSAAEGQHVLRVHLDFSTFARTSKELETWARAE